MIVALVFPALSDCVFPSYLHFLFSFIFVLFFLFNFVSEELLSLMHPSNLYLELRSCSVYVDVVKGLLPAGATQSVSLQLNAQSCKEGHSRLGECFAVLSLPAHGSAEGGAFEADLARPFPHCAVLDDIAGAKGDTDICCVHLCALLVSQGKTIASSGLVALSLDDAECTVLERLDSDDAPLKGVRSVSLQLSSLSDPALVMAKVEVHAELFLSSRGWLSAFERSSMALLLAHYTSCIQQIHSAEKVQAILRYRSSCRHVRGVQILAVQPDSPSKQSVSPNDAQNIKSDATMHVAEALIDALRNRLRGLVHEDAAISSSKLRAIEQGLCALLREEESFSRPTLLQVVMCDGLAEVDVVRQGVCGPRLSVERVPLSAKYVAEITQKKKLAAASAKRQYDDAMLNVDAATCTTEQNEDEKATQPSSPSAVPTYPSRTVNARLSWAAAQTDFALWRENKAIMQFALELLHAAEANCLPIKSDKDRAQPEEMLIATRESIAATEQSLRRNKSALDRANNTSNCNTSSDPGVLGAERVGLYREMELLRRNEQVLEACLLEKQQLMYLLHTDRELFVRSVADNKALLKEKDAAIRREKAETQSVRTQLEASERKVRELQRSLEAQTQHVEELQKYVSAIRLKQQQKGLAGPSSLPESRCQSRAGPKRPPSTPYDIVASEGAVVSPTKAKERDLIDRLYAQPLTKILHPTEPPPLRTATAESMSLEDFTKRMYYERKTYERDRTEALRNKYREEETIEKAHYVPKRSAEQIAENVKRMYNERVQEISTQRQKLYEKLILSREKASPKRSEEERQALAMRLYTTEKNAQQ